MINENEEKKEQMEEQQNKTTSNGKGSRTSKVSGQALKSQIKSGKLPSI